MDCRNTAAQVRHRVHGEQSTPVIFRDWHVDYAVNLWVLSWAEAERGALRIWFVYIFISGP